MPVDTNLDFTNFKLKEYWQKGYFWQCERIERKWCMRCRHAQCIIGDNFFIENCTDTGVQFFDFVALDNAEVLIKLYNTTDLCLQRDGREIFIAECNAQLDYQRWFAVTGGFDQYRFELSQRTDESLCVTTRHQPKAGENVHLEPCVQARWSDTSFWNRYYD
jgi:hypothetical protein